jgi:tRNA-guanine family transglycosylase
MYVERLLTSNNYRDIHKELEFEGYIFMDSGGFQFLRNKNINITPKTIFDIQNKSQADLASILDYPFHPKASIKEKINSIQTTLNNLKIYKSFIQKENTNTLFMPVIHGHDPVTLIKMAKKVRKIFGDEALCIGSLVPVLFPVKYGTIKDVARAFVEVRKVLPNSFIHVFGAGSSLSSHLFFYLGADSVDSATWIIKAGFGNIHLPGQGAAYITSDGRRSRCRFVDWNKYECECPVCRDKAPDEILKEMDRHDSYGRKLRAIHNAWVYLKEIEIVRNSIVEGEYENLVRQRMRNTSLRNIFETFTQIVKP